MELRRLRLLYELSRLGTVAAVAQALAYSPSSVSVQLAELEREAGAKLLRRAGRRLELTAAGQRLAVQLPDVLWPRGSSSTHGNSGSGKGPAGGLGQPAGLMLTLSS